MPRFYFHLTDGKRRFLDHDGVELPDLAAARSRAIMDIRDLRRLLSDGQHCDMWRFEIADATGRQVLTVPFAEADDRRDRTWSFQAARANSDARPAQPGGHPLGSG